MYPIAKRRRDLDFAKGCLIFLVIWGHICPNSSGADYANTWCALARINSLFLMSLFFMISGYVIKLCCTSSQLAQRLKKTFFRLVVPLFSWGVLFFLITSFTRLVKMWDHISSIFDYPIINYLFYFRKIALTVNLYWFISCLIICICLSSLLYYIKERIPGFIGRILIYVSIILIPFLPIHHFHFTFFWPFYIIGSLIKNDESIFSLSKRIIEMPAACLILLTLLCTYMGYSHKPIDSFYYPNNHPLWWLLLRYLVYLISSVCAFILFRKAYYSLRYNSVVLFIEKAGRETLFLYLSHMIILNQIYNPIVMNMTNSAGILPNYPIIRFYVYSTIFAIILFKALYYLTYIIKKNTVLKSVLLGK